MSDTNQPPVKRKKAGVSKGKVFRNTPRDLQLALNSRMIADFKKHGIKVIEKVREDSPVEYLKILTRLLPKDVNFQVEHTFSDVLLEAQRRITEREESIRDIEGEVVHDGES